MDNVFLVLLFLTAGHVVLRQIVQVVLKDFMFGLMMNA